MKWLPQDWNDILAIFVIIGLPLLLTFVYAAKIPLPDIVVGAFIGGWTLAVQFYYRKAPPEGGTE